MTPFDRLLTAARELLASRYRDGEVDAVAMSRFADVVDEMASANVPHAGAHEGHRLIVDKRSDTFAPRRGCLDCDVWIDPVRLIENGGSRGITGRRARE